MLGMSLGAVQASPAADPSGNETKGSGTGPSLLADAERSCRASYLFAGQGLFFRSLTKSRAKYVPNLFEMLFAGRTSP